MSLTVKAITAAKPGEIIRDDEVRGLHLRAFPDRKSFYLYYRFGGQERRPKLGDYGVLTINDARRIARSILLDVAEGKDPAERRRQGMTVDELADIWEKQQLPKRRDPSAAGHLRRIREHIGHLRVADLRWTDVEGMHRTITAKGTPIKANRVLAYTSILLTFAERIQERPANSNFCPTIERNPETKRKRYLRPGDEAQRVGAGLRARLYGPQHESVLFILLLLLTGARSSEIGQAREEDRRGNVLVIRDHKTVKTAGEKIIHLPDAAVKLLDDPDRPPHARTGYLVGVARPRDAWEAIREEAGCPDLRIHDLRHSFVSFGVGSGVSLSLAGLLVGHASPSTTKRYEHLIDDPAREAVNKIADAVGAALQLEHKDAAE
jgi:integrase